MPYYDAKFELEIFSDSEIEEEQPLGTLYPYLTDKGEMSFSHLPKDTQTVIVWQLGKEPDNLGAKDRVVVGVYEKTSNGRWVRIY